MELQYRKPRLPKTEALFDKEFSDSIFRKRKIDYSDTIGKVKKLFACLFLGMILISAGITSYGQATFYSQGTNLFNVTTNWDSNPLGGGTDPVVGDFTSGLSTFIIQDGHTVTANIALDVYDLTIGTGTSGILIIGNSVTARTVTVRNNLNVVNGGSVNVGAFASTHLLNLYGNLVVDGTFNMFNAALQVCNVVFLGASGNTVTGTGAQCNFNQITVNKGVTIANVLDIQRAITMSSPAVAGTFLTITNGTFELSGSSAINLTPYFGNATICAANGRLWINNPNAIVSCVGTMTSATPGTPTVTGTLQVTQGVFSYGSGNDLLTLNAATSNLVIDGGTVNIYGGVAFTSSSGLTMTAGNLNIDPQAFDNLAAATTIVNFSSTNATNAVTFTGGMITVVDPHSGSGAGVALFLTPTAGFAYNFDGSTILFGDGASNSNGTATDGFEINGGNQYALGDITVNNGTSAGTDRFVRLVTTNCIIGGDLTIGNNPGDDFRLNARSLFLRGNLINNGIFTSAIAGSSISMSGTSQQTISGTGTFTDGTAGRILNLIIDNTSGSTPSVDLQYPVLIGSNGSSLSLTNGALNSSGTGSLTLGTGAASTFTINRTNGSLSLAPVWNLAGVTCNINYLASTGILSTGNEIPSTAEGNIGILTVNNASGVLLDKADITIAGSLTLTNGVIDMQNNTINFITSNTPLNRTTGTLTTSSGSVLNFGTPAAMLGNTVSIPANYFTNSPVLLGDLSVNKSTAGQGLTWNGQGLTINGTLTLNMNGVFTIGANTLTFQNGDIPIVRTSGTITTAAGTSLVFGSAGNTGGAAFSLPSGLFTAASPGISAITVNRDNKLTWNSQNFSLTGALTLTKGEFDLNGVILTTTAATPFARTDGTLTPSSASLVFNANAAPFTIPDDLYTSAPSSLTNLTLNRGAGIIMTLGNQEINVTGTTSLTNGIIEIKDADIQVNTVAAGSSVTRMFVANGTGYLKKNIAAGASSFTFPVGDITGTPEFTPATLTFTANTSAGTLGIRVTDAKHPVNTETDNFITRYWSFSAPFLANYNYSAVFTYPNADVVGADEANFKMQRYDNGTLAWTTDIGSNTVTGANSLLNTSPLDQITGRLNNNDFTSFSTADIYYWSRNTANWNAATAWVVSSTNVDPGAGGIPSIVPPTYANNKGITIRSGHIITANLGTYTADEMSIAAGGTLNLGVNNFTLHNGTGADLTIDGAITTTGGQILSNDAGVDITINGTINTSDPDGLYISANSTISTTNAPALTLGATSSINFNGAAGQAVDARSDYANLLVAAAGAKTAQGPITVNRDLSITTATFADNGNTITVKGGVNITGTHSGAGKLYLNGGTASHAIAGGTGTFGNLELEDPNGATFTGTGTSTISGNLTLTRGTLVLNGFSTSLIVNGTTTIGAGVMPSALTFNSTVGTRLFTGLVTIGANGTWNNAANESITMRGGIVNLGTFTAGTGTYTFDTNSQSLTGTFVIPGITVTGITLTNNNSLTVNAALAGNGALTQATNAILNIGFTGAVGITTLNSDAVGNTVNYNFAGAQTIKAPSVSYFNLTGGNSGIKTVPAAITVTGDLILSAGTIATGANVLQVNGNVLNNGTHTATTGSITLTGGAAAHNITGTGSYQNLVLNDAFGALLGSSAIVNGTLTLTAGVLKLGAFDLTLASVTAIAGSPFSITNMVETNGTGRLVRSVSSPNNTGFNQTYPVGSGGFYNPVTVSGLAGGGVAVRSFSVRAIPVNPGILSNTINKYWDITSAGITGLPAATISFTYNAGEVVGDPLLFQPFTNASGSWSIAPGPSAAGVNPATSTGNAVLNGSWTVGSPSTFYSYQSGNWDQTSTWTFDPGGTTGPGILVPGQNDKVVILSGRTVSLSANVFTQNLDITINNGGILNQGTRRFTNTLAALRGDGILKLASSFFPAATINTFVSTDGGTTEYNHNGNMSASQTTYYHLVIRSAGTVSPVNDLSLNGDLHVIQGTFEINDAFDNRLKLVINGDFIVDNSGLVTVSPIDTRSDSGPLPEIDGITGGFLNYYENNSHRIEIFGDFTNNGSVRFTNQSFPEYDQFPADGFATVYFHGLSDNTLIANGQTDFYNLIVDKGTDQTFKLTIQSSAYNNFRLFGANVSGASVTFPIVADENPNIRKALWIKNGTLVLQGIVVIPSLSEGASAAGYPNSDFIIPANGAFILNGPGVIVLSTADSYAEVNAAYGLAGGSDISYGINTSGGFSGISNLGKLQVNDGYLSTRESSGLNYWGFASGQFIINGGKVDTKQFHDPDADGTGLESFVQSGGAMIIRGRFKNNITAVNPADLANVTINTARSDIGIDVTSGIASFSINNNPANGFSMSGGSLSIYDVCNTNPAPLALLISCPPSNISVSGGTVNLIPTTGSVLGDADFMVNTTGPLYNFVINRASGGSVVQLNTNPLVVLNNLALTSGSFTANDLDVTVGGNLTIESGTVYTPGNNTTTLNGSADQSFTINLGAPLSLNRLTVDKTAGVSVNFAGSQKTVNVSGDFRLVAGTVNDNGNTINIAGNVFNSGIHSGTGKIVLNGTALQVIDGNGVFGNIDLFNTNAAASPVSLSAGMTVNGALNFANDKSFDINIFNVTLNANSSVLNAGSSRYLKSAGNAGDGGLTKVFSLTAPSFDFPVGVNSYTPGSLTVNGTPAAFGSITVIPVNYEHPNVTTTGRSLTYFWRTKSSGFDLTGATVTHKYTYADGNIITGGDVTEDGYVAARFNVPTSSWTKGLASDVDQDNNIIGGPGSGGFLEGSSVINGDFTAGDDDAINPFGLPAIYYSRQTGLWRDGNTWSLTGHTGAAAGTWPGASDIVIIGTGHVINLDNNPAYPLNNVVVSCASLQIETGGTLDIGNNPASSFVMVQSHPSGNGLFRLTATRATAGNIISIFSFPSGDFSDFNVNLGTTEFYTTTGLGSSLYILPPVSYIGNMILSPQGVPASGDNMVLQNIPLLTVYGDLTLNGASNASAIGMSWNTNDADFGFSAAYLTVEKTVTVKGDLNINGGSLTFYDDIVPQHLVVEGDINISSATNGASIIAWDSQNGWSPNFGGPTLDNTLIIGGNLNNNGTDAGIFRGLNLFWNDASPHWVDVTFTGSNNTVVTGSGTVIYHKLTVNKGTTQASTLTVNSTGTQITPVDNWLTLQNGTVIYNRTGNLSLSTITPFTIAQTAGLTVNTPSNVNIANSNLNTNDLILNGKLTVINGNVYIGPAVSTNFNNDIEYSVGGTSSIDVQGGNLIVNGQIRRNPSSVGGILKYSQSGGSVTVRGQNQDGTNAKFEVVNAGSSFTMSNGTLTILRGNGGTTTPSSPFGDLYLRPETGSVTGGTIIFSQVGMVPAPVTPQNYFLDATLPLYNVIITGISAANYATVRLLTNPLTVNGDFTISANSVFNTNNINATFNGNLINTPGVNGYIAGTNLTTFSALNSSSYAGAQSITGTTNFYDLTVAPGASLTLNNPSTINRNLTLNTGTFILGGNPVIVRGNVANNASYTDNNAAGTGLLLNGTTQQQISGAGAFARLTLNNATGARIENNITIQEDLTMTLGILDIRMYLLTLGTNSNLQGAPFSATKMIASDGVFSNVGLRKFFNPGPATFLYPIGTNGKYTPALLTATASSTVGYVRLNNISGRHPAVLDPANSLDYYWEVQSSGITGFDGQLELNYLESDVAGDESNYQAARITVPGTAWTITPLVDPVANKIITTHNGSNNLSGEYTAGIPSAFFTSVPEYTTIADGLWTDKTIWSQTGGTINPVPDGGPDGFIVYINHVVTISANDITAYRTTINGELRIGEPYFGHNFGTVTGNGILHLERGTFPAGVYTAFLSCAGGGTVDYGGTGSYTIIADLYDNIPNLLFTGSGTRVLPNKDLTICSTFTVNGPVVDNSVYNKKLTIQGSMRHLAGSFNAGTGPGAIVSFAGTAPQTIGGPVLGDFTGTSAFNHFEINNISGLRVNDNGAIEVKGNLLLTSGLINTGANRTLTITNSAINSVVPSGGKITSFIDGPLTKLISQYDNFLFPIGINKSGTNVLGNKLNISSTQAGPTLWTAQYKNPNPTSTSFTPPILGVSAMEYFTIEAAAGSLAKVNINWTPSSDVNPVIAGGIPNIRIANYNAGSWIEVPTTASGDNSNGTASSSGFVTFSGSDDYTLGSVTTLIPRASLNPSGPVCGVSGIPVTFTAPGAIPFNYTLSYTRDGVAQAPVTITPALIPYTLPTPVPGVYRLTGFLYNSGANTGVVDATPVTANATPTTADAGTMQTLCGVSTATLAGNVPLVGTGQWSIISGASGTIISPNNPASQFIGLNGTSYTLRWTITSGTCVSFADVIINFTILPDPPAAATPQNFCVSATIANLVATAPVGCTVDWYSAATGGVLLPPATVLVSGTTYFAESNGGCVSLTRTPVLVNIYPNPSPALVGSNSVCLNSTGNVYTTDAGKSNYVWTVVGGSITLGGLGTDNTATVTWNTVGPQTISVNYRDLGGCSASTPTTLNVTVHALPVPTIAGPDPACEGSTGNTYITEPGMTNYLWSISAGGLITAGGGTGNNLVVVTWNTPGVQTVGINYTDGNGCTAPSEISIPVTINPLPGAAGAISGTATVCQGQNSVAYTVGAITGATSYSWAYSGTGATITGTTNNITIDFAANATPGNLTVQGVNACGSGTLSANYVITVNPLPLQPAAFTASTATVCQGVNGVVYTVPNDATVTYTWSYSGTGATINGTTNSVTVDFSTTATSGTLSVTATNGCGVSAARTLAITVNPLPLQPAAFTASTATVCQGVNGVVYTVPNDATVTYTWSYSGTGATINGTTNSVTVDFSTTATSGTLSVTATNGCGVSAARTLAITVNPLPLQPAAFTASTATVCQGVNGVVYTVPNDATVTYTWSYSGTGATINGTTNSVTVDFSTTATSGTLSVTATNGCGISAARTLAITVNPLPLQPAAFTASTATVCQGVNGVVYTVPNDATVTYTWSYSGTGATINGTTNSVTVDFSTTATSGTLSVTATNGCGISAARTLAITVNPLPLQPAAFTASTATVCQGVNGVVYTVPNDATVTYTWSYSGTGATINGTTNSVTVDFSTTATSGTLSVTATNGCGVSAARTLAITVNPLPLQPAAFTASTATVCQGVNGVVYTVPNDATVTYTWSYSGTGATINGTTNSVTVDFSTTATSGTLSVTATNGCGVSAARTLAITVNPLPLQPAAFTASTATVCQGVNGVVYTVPNDATVTYTWSYSGTGATINGTTNSVTVDFSTTATSGTLSVTATNGCGISAARTLAITVTPLNTIILTSAAGTDAQIVCINTAIAPVTYATTGATGATFSGLPTGVIGNWAAGVVTISGIPSVPGPFTYSVLLTGGCGTVSINGTINVTPNNTITLSSGPANQSHCINTAITNITFNTTGATGATFTNLPLGVTGIWAANTVTISGTPIVDGIFNYTVNLTGGCGTISAGGILTINPENTIILSSAIGTDDQVVCVNSAITVITYSTSGATGADYTNLPAGMSVSWAANTVTISGTPSVPGTYNYTIDLTGGCGNVSATGRIIVNPDNTITLTSGVPSTNQTLCVNAPINNITYSTTGATGANYSGLPAGVNGIWAGDVVTISGTPTTDGIYNYTVTLTGGCGTISASGTINVTPDNTIILTSGAGTNSQTVCNNAAIIPITYSTTGATDATFSGLPGGVSGDWNSDVITITGIPVTAGIYNYSITLTGGCGIVTESGTITVSADNTISLSSVAGTDNQTICINTPLVNITYTTTGATGATFAGLPAGVSGLWAADVITISGIPTVAGTNNFTVTLTGGCGTAGASGTIIVNPDNTIILSSVAGTDNQIVCVNTPIIPITYSTTDATGATFAGLPSGVSGIWAGDQVTISGTPSSSGTANFTVTLTGGCGNITATGVIDVTPANSINLTSVAGTDNQTVCTGSTITDITYSTTGATGATFTGLPAGVNGIWAAGTITISGIPTASGSYAYVIELTGGCGIVTTGGSITVPADNTLSLSSVAGTDMQAVCLNTAITNITYGTTGATGATVTGLPAGITSDWAANTVTISGTPTVPGLFNYLVTLTGGCGAITVAGSIEVILVNEITLTSGAGTDNQSVCVNNPITAITYNTKGATGANYSGLPAGMAVSFATNTVTISGTPTIPGPYNYIITLTGGCGVVTANGSIMVNPDNVVSLTSAAGTDNQTGCLGNPIIPVSYSTTGATDATYTGLPAGVTGSWAANTITISGIPTATGIFNYTVTLTGGCGTVITTGTFNIGNANTITLTSGAPTTSQTLCINTAISDITYATTGATGAIFSGLPSGVTGTWIADVVTISGIPSTAGINNYSVTLTGGCGNIIELGSITVTDDNTIALTSAAGTDNQTVCINNAITDISWSTTGATGGSVTGLPAGVTGTWAADVVTINGTPTESGIFNYTVNLTGGCGIVSTTGSLTVNILLPVSVTITADLNPVCSGATTTFTAIAVNEGTTPIYQWQVNGTNAGTDASAFSYIPVNGDIISVILTSAEQCQTGSPAVSPSITMTVNTVPSGLTTSTDVACFGEATGDIDLVASGGTPPYTYLWSNGATSEDLTDVIAGIYTVIITDANNCTGTTTGTINEPVSALSVSVDSQINVTTIGGNDGSVTVISSGGTLPHLYSLDGGPYQASTTFSTLTAGTYTVTVQDLNMCSAFVTVTITQPFLPLSGSSTQTDVLCFGDATGSLTVTGIEGVTPYEYSLGGGTYQASGTFGTLAAGPYTVTIRDAVANTFDVTITILQPAAALTVATSKDDVSCNGNADGIAVALPSGGTGSYTYSWNTTPVQSADTATGLSGGTYTVVITDANSCTVTADVNLTEPEVLSLNAIPADAGCPDSPDGSVTLEITGGTPVYSVNWEDGNTNQNRTGILPGTYSVVVTDINGCTASTSAVVSHNGTYDCLVIPEVLTPEPADGFNDEWIIRNIDIYPNAEIKIYSRWGKLIYHTKNPLAEPWDGRYSNGRLVPTDSYYYMLELHDGSKPRSGVISVIR